ncbi:MAG: isopentenyl-diphosphate Delta-isomerase [Nakamurella sp.]
MHEGPTDDLVVLVDPAGTPIGSERKSRVHTTDTPLHLAFSVYLFDGAGNVLMTRRALSKLTWPGVWTNSCCGHQRLDEPPAEGVRRRTRAELGLQITDLRCVLPDFAYRARDAGGIVENEICPVFVGTVAGPVPEPDDSEVMEWAWLPWRHLVTAVTGASFAFSPWCVQQIRALQDADDDRLASG